MSTNKANKVIQLKEQEIAELAARRDALDAQIKEKSIFLDGMKDVLKFIPKEQVTARATVRRNPALQPGSEVAKVRDILFANRKPMHINAIITALGKESTKSARVSLSSSLAAYVRRGKIFTRPQPNTFYLEEAVLSEGANDLV